MKFVSSLSIADGYMGGRDALISARSGEVIEATRARERLDPCTPRGA